jgi:hypothetical protein
MSVNMQSVHRVISWAGTAALSLACSAFGGQDTGKAPDHDGMVPSETPPSPSPPTGAGRPGQELGVTWTVSGGDMYQFQSSIDGGGSFSVNRAYLGARLQYRFSPSLRIGFKLNTEIDSYDFKGGGSFADAAGGTPWTTTQEFSIGGSAEWKIDDRWTIFGSGSARWAGEPDADWGSSFSTSGVIAGSYTFSRDLTLGAGLLASGRLDGSVLFIPSLLIDWTITDRLVVTNVRGPATYPASAGIELIYAIEDDLSFAIGFRYEYRRFRLDDSGPVTIHGGVGTERSFPMWLRLEWRPAPKLRLHLLGGISFGEKLELQNAGGVTIEEQDVKPAPFVALFFGFKF